MKKSAVVFLFACTLLLPGSAGSISQPGLIRIYAVTTGVAGVNLGPKSWSAGDETFQGVQLRDRHERVIGYGALSCTAMGATLPGRVSLCRAVYVLPKGKIIASGSRQRVDFYVLAVLGGTGLYYNVQGTLIASTVSLRPRRERLFFSLTAS